MLRGTRLIYFSFKGLSTFIIFPLFQATNSSLELILVLDTLRLAFLFSVRTIASAVIRFAKSYIANEIFYSRFSLLVIRFVGSIFLLILSPNLIRILLGWDGLGVTSYLLVIYYYRTKSANAGIITALTNRVGDVAILILIGLALQSESWNFHIRALESPTSSTSILCVIITLAAITKRAQIPFSAWLPAAMAAPTPVSALVHSSTLVTAGVYLLIRFNLHLAERNFSVIILFFGSITILIAGLSAIFEMDIKKIVALSTLRQLGLIIRALGIGRPDIAFFHLLTHAYFKALLFMCAGNLIHCSNDFQDLRQIGAMAPQLPVTTRFINLSNIRLCGLPFLAGFYSKDIFLEVSLLSTTGAIALFLFFLATLLTIAYSLRFTLLTSLRTSHSSPLLWLRDEDRVITSGIWVLLPLAVIGGALLRWVLFNSPVIILLPLTLKLGAILVTVLGGLVSALTSLNNLKIFNSILRWTRGTIWILPLISSRAWLKNSLTWAWIMRELVENSTILRLYHSAPHQLTANKASLQEGTSVNRFLYLIRLAFLWSSALVIIAWLLY